jgi:mRNA-degrading endonuclease toxin of MazEF toxin-antitoxin module
VTVRVTVHRGDVYRRAALGRDRHFVVISSDDLNVHGTAVVAEIGSIDSAATRTLVAVPLDADDPVAGGTSVITWRLNYVNVGRLGERVGELTPTTLAAMSRALRIVLDL